MKQGLGAALVPPAPHRGRPQRAPRQRLLQNITRASFRRRRGPRHIISDTVIPCFRLDGAPRSSVLLAPSTRAPPVRMAEVSSPA